MNYLDQEVQRYEHLDESERPNYFERPEDVSRHLLEIEPNETGVIDLDTARANLNPEELKSIRAIGGLINDLDLASKLIPEWNFSKDIKFYRNEMSTTTVPSRAKHGWAAVLSKTDKKVNISEAQEMAYDISNAFEQQVDEGLVGKLRETGILKKRQVWLKNGYE